MTQGWDISRPKVQSQLACRFECGVVCYARRRVLSIHVEEQDIDSECVYVRRLDRDGPRLLVAGTFELGPTRSIRNLKFITHASNGSVSDVSYILNG